MITLQCFSSCSGSQLFSGPSQSAGSYLSTPKQLGIWIVEGLSEELKDFLHVPLACEVQRTGVHR